MALVKVNKIMLKYNTDFYKSMWVSNSSFDSFELNLNPFERQSIDFYTCPYGDIRDDELYNFIIRAARGNWTNNGPGPVVYANPNLDIYFFASDGTVCRGQITRENITFPSDNSSGTIHLEFYLYHDMNPMTTRKVDSGDAMITRSFHGTVPGIDRIIFNNPATIVYWHDGTKTVVKAHDEEFSEEHGLAMAFARKVLENCYGNKNPRAGFKRLVREATHY